MGTFHYFIPNRKTLKREDAAALGLAYAFERSIDATECVGPSGLQGIVCAEAGRYAEGRNAVSKTGQEWVPLSGQGDTETGRQGEGAWVGAWKDALPGPDDLARERQIAGFALELADGKSWEVPVARSYREVGDGDEAELRWTTNLPRRLALATDGRWASGAVVPRYAALWELAESWLRLRAGAASAEDRERLNDQFAADGATLALQANYRLGRAECSLLGLFDDALAERILDQLIDEPTMLAFAKKKMQRTAQSPTPVAGWPSSGGPAAEIPITGQPSPT